MNVKQIKNIEDLINLPNDQKITGHKVARLTAPGENYGSLMLRVDIAVKTSNGTEEIHTAAKMIPPNDFLQDIFNTPVTFRNEIGFYKHIVPTLQSFQKDHGVGNVIDFSPKYYGSRLNLTGNNQIDEDAILVLENLKVAKFVTLERTEGLDLDVAKLIITDLAHLHAVPLALKLKKPVVFEKKVKPYLSLWLPKETNHNFLKAQLSNVIDQIEELTPLKERILVAFDKQMLPTELREPFATVTHNDCWTNNNMVKLEDGKPVRNKMVDFQMIDYGSPAKDLLLFLFASVKSEVVARHYDDLLLMYFQIFLSVLKELECDATAFRFEGLLEELDKEARASEFGHVAFMLFSVFASKDSAHDISELTRDNMSRSDEVTDLFKEKLVFVVREFIQRNWI